jgi:cytoskeletal protein RodZ
VASVRKPTFQGPLREGIKRPRFDVSRLSPRSRGALFLNLALVLLIGIVWWLILRPDPEPEAATTESTPVVAEQTPAAETPTPTPAPTPAPTGETYTVASGDTLASIGAKLGVEWQKIAEANGLTEPYDLQIGQVLKIPR